MDKRSLRVVKFLSNAPAIGLCTYCSKKFTVPLTALSKIKTAEANLQEQFERHKCERGGTGRKARGVIEDVGGE